MKIVLVISVVLTLLGTIRGHLLRINNTNSTDGEVKCLIIYPVFINGSYLINRAQVLAMPWGCDLPALWKGMWQFLWQKLQQRRVCVWLLLWRGTDQGRWEVCAQRRILFQTDLCGRGRNLERTWNYLWQSMSRRGLWSKCCHWGLLLSNRDLAGVRSQVHRVYAFEMWYHNHNWIVHWIHHYWGGRLPFHHHCSGLRKY